MRLTTGHLALRAEEGGDGRTLEGLAVPYGVEVTGPTREYGDAPELFAPGSFRDVVAAGRTIPVLDRHEGQVVGTAQLEDTEEGLRFRGRLLASSRATEYAEQVTAGVDGVSIEFLPGQVRRQGRRVIHTQVRTLAAIAGAYAPAYTGAHVAVRGQEDASMDQETLETTAPEPAPSITEADVRRVAGAIARTEAEAAMRSLAESGLGAGRPADPVAQFRSLGALLAAARETPHGDALRNLGAIGGLHTRAWVDQVTTDNPGVMGVGGTIHGIIAQSRPAITAFGTTGLGDRGMEVEWPYFDGDLSTLVGLQSTEKTEIVSAKVSIKRGHEAIKTYAGGSDISYQLIRRSDPAYLEAYGRIMLAAYAVVTDKAFLDAIVAAATGTVTGDLVGGNAAAIMEALFGASVKVETATGAPASFVLAASDVFVKVAGKLTPQPVQNAVGYANAATLAVNAGGLPVIHDPRMAAGTALASNRLAAAWAEDGPMLASDEDVAKLGRDVAYWGMAAPAVYIPTGIVKIAKSGV
jgi:Escherichia/Staphylococcus phage prohead protease